LENKLSIYTTSSTYDACVRYTAELNVHYIIVSTANRITGKLGLTHRGLNSYSLTFKRV